MTILFVSDFLPHINADSQGVLDAAMLLDDLTKHCKVDLITNVSRNDANKLDEFKRKCNQVIPVQNRTFDRRIFYVLKTFISFFSRLPSIMYMSYSLRFKILLKDILQKNEYDIVIIEFTQMIHFIPLIRKYKSNAKIVVDESDVAFIRRQRYITNNFSGIMKVLLLYDNNKLRRNEIAFLNLATAVLVRTENDWNILKSNNLKLDHSQHHVFSSYIDFTHASEYRALNKVEKNIMFFGAMWRPVNEEAMLFFISYIFDKIVEKIPDVKLFIVGSRPSSKLLNYQKSNIIITGFVSDVQEYYYKSKVVIAPLRSGSGVKGKVIQALGFCRPVVTTDIGIEGIDLTEKDYIYVRNDPQSFADKVVELLEDDVPAQLIQNGARIMKKFNWSMNFNRIYDFIKEVSND